MSSDKVNFNIDPVIKRASTSTQKAKAKAKAMVESNDGYVHINDDNQTIQPQQSASSESRQEWNNDHAIHIPARLAPHSPHGPRSPNSPFSHGENIFGRRHSLGSAIISGPTSGVGRFRKAADEVTTPHKHSPYALRGQGVNPSDMDSIFGCIENLVDVMVMDMCQIQHTKREHMDNTEFLEWLDEPRPEWSKVRWININGMSWDVIKAVSIKYNLHHLAVEDLLHVPQRTKVDIYPEHTYIACTLLTLMEALENGELKQVDPSSNDNRIDPEILNQRFPLDKMDHFKYQFPINEVMGGLRVQMEQVTMFLIKGGILITLFQVSGESVVGPIAERLTLSFSLVRKNNDASFLLQSVMDGIVDHAIPIMDAFRQEINELEAHVLALPRMRYTRELHHMTAQLSMLKRTLAPTQALVHALKGKDERSPLSNLSKTYMGDVMDHCNTMVEDIDSMLALCEKLINMVGLI
ncbi:hypothetical protein BGX21_000845 [Mortierella sp. AD011]|nr:hypothetical protein BGX21_000845 [Mortierella sp. AD011]